MSFDFGNALSAIGIGAINGVNQFKQEQKAEEEKQYNRGRQAEADRQQLELHNQAVKQNNYSLGKMAVEEAQIQRRNKFGQQIEKMNQFQLAGDDDGAFRLYTDNANSDNNLNPNWNQNHVLSYTRDPDNGTYSLNIVDKNTGKFIQQAKSGLSVDDLISNTYSQIDPLGQHESKIAAQAKRNEEIFKGQIELNKLDVQHKYKLGEQENNFNNDLKRDQLKYNHDNELEGVRQKGAYDRTLITALAKGDGNTKASNAVQSGMQGALSFAQNNSEMLGFLNSNPDLYKKTVAMMGIESAGNPNANSYDNSSYGLMQLNKKYASGFAKQYGINGDPLTNVEANIKTGAAHIQNLDKKYGGNTDLIAAAYNAGEPAVDAALKRWEKSGKNGTWFDHLNINQAAREQVYNHIVKYNQALGLVGNQSSNNVDIATKAKDGYVKALSVNAAASISNVAKSMSDQLGVGADNKSASASIIGSLSGTQVLISQFANSQTSQGRANAYNGILNLVTNAVKSTEAGKDMDNQQRIEYVHQKAAELVGASNKIEAGQWIRNPNLSASRARKQEEDSRRTIGNYDEVFANTSVNNAKIVQKPKNQPVQKSQTLKPPMMAPKRQDMTITNSETWKMLKSRGLV